MAKKMPTNTAAAFARVERAKTEARLLETERALLEAVAQAAEDRAELNKEWDLRFVAEERARALEAQLAEVRAHERDRLREHLEAALVVTFPFDEITLGRPNQ